jgi:RNA polymerase sigma factor (sigma-70 family)
VTPPHSTHGSAHAAPSHPAGRWYASHHAWLVVWLQRKMGCPHGAADLAQDTFVRVLAAREIEQVAEPRAFLTTLAKRVLFSHWRRRELEQAYLQALAESPQATAPSPEDMAVLHEALQAIDQRLNGLPAKVKQAFLLHRLDGLTHVQIACEMGISVASVERYMKQAYLHCCRQDTGVGHP